MRYVNAIFYFYYRRSQLGNDGLLVDLWIVSPTGPQIQPCIDDDEEKKKRASRTKVWPTD